ncbi:MAG: shikimate dehydrogenase [Candidatus Bathyarchaeia archaeon]
MESPKISSRTRVYGIIGDPVDHSISPIFQNAAFRKTGLDGVYVAFQVKSRYLKSAVTSMKALGISGFSVTIPHKIRVMQYCDTLDKEASVIGSVNTIVNRKGSLKGFSTDGRGALQSVGIARLRGSSVLLLGAGGAARAIAHTFAPEVRRISIMNRTISNAQQLERALRRRYQCQVSSAPLTEAKMKELVENAELIVNASSMGMNGKNDPPIRKAWLNPSQTVLDIVYAPRVTTLLRNAQRAGARRIDGFGMLLSQGALSFKLWTGKSAPIAEMQRALSREIMNYADS